MNGYSGGHPGTNHAHAWGLGLGRRGSHTTAGARPRAAQRLARAARPLRLAGYTRERMRKPGSQPCA